MVDLDATLITAHSEKEDAEPPFKKGFGFHPLCGRAGSNTAADHIGVTQAGLPEMMSTHWAEKGR